MRIKLSKGDFLVFNSLPEGFVRVVCGNCTKEFIFTYTFGSSLNKPKVNFCPKCGSEKVVICGD